jgi:hypothetical protein
MLVGTFLRSGASSFVLRDLAQFLDVSAVSFLTLLDAPSQAHGTSLALRAGVRFSWPGLGFPALPGASLGFDAASSSLTRLVISPNVSRF